jgi:N-acetylated-alpha-linked acidic dipeptidase
LIAQEEDVAALLLYPEMRDQGFRKAAYPNGPGWNPFLVQRGSMLDFFEHPGEPGEAQALPSVPAIPISSDTAAAILKHIEGGDSPKDWQGWMSVPYRIGSGPAKVKVVSKQSLGTCNIRNIFAKLPASNSVEPGLLISAHYDAWMYGASDPASATATVLETAQALAAMHKKGWAPAHPITFAFWDGEEFGMFGSTKWTQKHLNEIPNQFFAALYTDGIRSHSFSANLSPGFGSALDDVLHQVKDPDSGKPVSEIRSAYNLPVYSTDTTPMTLIAGLPTIQLNYGITYPMYHSVYDNLNWMQKFGDPNYRYTANMAKVFSLYTIRLTSEKIIPWRASEMAKFIANEVAKRSSENPSTKLVDSVNYFQKQATQWDAYVEKSKTPEKANAVMMKIIRELPPGLLYAPSRESGCGSDSLPNVDDGRLLQALDHSANELSAAQR